MANIFTDVNMSKPRTNTFNLSHERKFDAWMGELIPVLSVDTVPGDDFKINTSQLLRFAPMIAPMMHSVNVYFHFFFVPNRILWDGWEDFITGGEDGQDASVFPFTLYNQPSYTGILADYLGLPTGNGTAAPQSVSALPVAGINKIWNEYYRDQNLQDPKDDKLVDGDNTATFNTYLFENCPYRAWQHDYFTSALPWTQKGPEATIPIGERADLAWETNSLSSFPRLSADGSIVPNATMKVDGSGRFLLDNGTTVIDEAAFMDNSNNMYADLSTATASSINDLRRAFKLQEWLEKNARGGSRYTESILSHFGVKSSDGRLQRPEFLGGSTAPVSISEVLQTSSNQSEPTPQGNMAGHGISVGGSRTVSYRCEEHGYIHGLMSIMPKTGYFQGIPKHFQKFDKFDYFWPSFAHIGEQPIYNRELYVGDDNAVNDSVFGYTPRYAEYKYMPDTVHGEYRESLDFWHMARRFNNTPVLNEDFITCVPTERVFAVSAAPCYVHVYNKIKARRPMPYFGNPKM